MVVIVYIDINKNKNIALIEDRLFEIVDKIKMTFYNINQWNSLSIYEVKL